MTETTQFVIRTPLAGILAGKAASLSPYCGAETPTSFGDVTAEFAALTESCGVFDLGWRGKITATGEDRARWFNGMLTNNIKDLALNTGNYNFVLNAQGRILGDLFLYNRGEYFLLDTDRSQIEPLLKILNHFIIMDDVELSDASDKLTSIGFRGPQAEAILGQLEIAPSAEYLTVHDLTWDGTGISLVRAADAQVPSYEIWIAPERVAALWDALASAGARPVGSAALEKYRVMSGAPRYGQDITERYLPQETEQTQALNFTKGCYIGQEIVERIRSRGQVHRLFTGFVLDGPVQPGDKIAVDGKDVGEITSIDQVTLPGTSEAKYLALGYIRREAESSGTRVTVGSLSGTVSALPFR